jgi:hypothetical protein
MEDSMKSNTPAASAFARAIRDQQSKGVYAPAKIDPMKTDRRFFKELRFRQFRASGRLLDR